ncbi:MAG: sulfur carrier protein ThiS [Gammaproteobacteria bacterium]|nr:sulfur carrier protein ThiS [Gammaproteobacteria bacterium]MBL6999393.1 sulfur carrier protein ThiS [Gammaproteobacteria bacterium]
MQVTINGESQTFNDPISVLALLDQSGLAEKRVAVEINENIVPRSLHAATMIADGDTVEIIQAIGGG